MRTCGIIAEFNPFHNGHEYLINKARESGYDNVIAIMSGNFVQRGEPAVFETGVRTGAALRAGADLVIQLPVIYALSGARNFARGSAGILDATGIVDTLAFGSECADGEKLEKTADLLRGNTLDEAIKSGLSGGITYAAARENALRAVNPELADIIREPNNILAIEYISALKTLGSNMKTAALKRTVGHDSQEKSGSFASASSIRKMIYSGEDFYGFVPAFYKEFTDINAVSFNKFETAVLCKLRNMKAEEIALLPDISEGIENRIYKAAQTASTLEELYFSAKTKRYTLARIRRIVLCALIGITREDAALEPPYIRI
ncbi:MAG: nucleotidyltransferase family protein, partial [Clostridia bacterium]|nr:nucleotidyltransferase family protein [Clostridia bacterium]